MGYGPFQTRTVLGLQPRPVRLQVPFEQLATIAEVSVPCVALAASSPTLLPISALESWNMQFVHLS